MILQIKTVSAIVGNNTILVNGQNDLHALADNVAYK